MQPIIEKKLKKEGLCSSKTFYKCDCQNTRKIVYSVVKETLEDLKKWAEKIDVSGGGSGRRLQIQLLDKLSNEIKELE